VLLRPARRFAALLMEARPEGGTGRVDPGRLAGAVELQNLWFRYAPQDPPVLAGVSLRLEPGEFVAIVGRSGAGKSTPVRLLPGLAEPSAGAIYVDGHDIRGVDLSVLRRQVATVLEHAQAPPGTILDVVRGSRAEASEAELWEALEGAAIAEEPSPKRCTACRWASTRC
jgi:ABC-type multidrug transport system fused ATPase/permease subunit